MQFIPPFQPVHLLQDKRVPPRGTLSFPHYSRVTIHKPLFIFLARLIIIPYTTIMMKQIEQKSLDNILSALDKQMQAHHGKPFHIVVCGGTAMIFLGLVHRTTTDVDILGQLKGNSKQIDTLMELPDWFQKAATTVKRDFNLPDNWINTGPAAQVTSGLPSGIGSRLITRKYGTLLTVSYISRIDQVHFKLYAAIDRGGYHVDDLLNLNPSTDELVQGAGWVLTQDVSVPFRQLLISFLRQKGYEHVIDQI